MFTLSRYLPKFGNSKKVDKAQVMQIPAYLQNNISAVPSWMKIQERQHFLQTYYQVPEYAAIKNYMATNFAQFNYELTKKSGRPITESPYLDLLKNPNAIQTNSEFLISAYLNWKVFGNLFVAKLQPAGFTDPEYTKLFVLPSEYTHIVLKKGINPFDIKTKNKSDLVAYYAVVYGGEIILKLEPNEVLHINEPNLNFNLSDGNWMYGKSDQIALTWPLSNLKAVYEAENVLINNKGPLGIISNDNNYEHGVQMPFNSKQKTDLQADIEGYGLKHSKMQWIITNLAMKFTPVSFPVKDLMLGDTYKRAVNILCAASKFPPLLLNLDDTTFNNQKAADKMLYQNALIPNSNEFIEGISKLIGITENNLVLKSDYSHIAVLQEDEKLSADTDKIVNETCEKNWNAGIITRNDWRKKIGLDEINKPEFNQYIFELNTNQNTIQDDNSDASTE